MRSETDSFLRCRSFRAQAAPGGDRRCTLIPRFFVKNRFCLIAAHRDSLSDHSKRQCAAKPTASFAAGLFALRPRPGGRSALHPDSSIFHEEPLFRRRESCLISRCACRLQRMPRLCRRAAPAPDGRRAHTRNSADPPDAARTADRGSAHTGKSRPQRSNRRRKRILAYKKPPEQL